MNVLLMLSCWVYFAGDNLHNSVQGSEKIRIASVTLLFTGLTGFRLIPALKEAIDGKQADEVNYCNWSSHTIIKMLHLVPEIDGWFTQVTAIVALAEMSDASVICIDDGSANVSATDDGPICAGDYRTAMWIIYIFIVVLSLIEASIQFWLLKSKNINLGSVCCECCSKLVQKHQNVIKFCLLFCMPVMVFLFLIGDNSHPLDWTVKCISSKSKADNIIRIFAVFASLVVYITLIFFYVKKKWKDKKYWKDIRKCWKDIRKCWKDKKECWRNSKLKKIQPL